MKILLSVIVVLIAACGVNNQTSTTNTANTLVASSIDLTFGGPDGFSTDDYRIPNKKDTAQVNLIKLVGPIESICYNGNVRNVIAMLDRIVENAGASVKEYSRSSSNNALNYKLKVKSVAGGILKADVSDIKSCR
jgi:hypothetical protein